MTAAVRAIYNVRAPGLVKRDAQWGIRKLDVPWEHWVIEVAPEPGGEKLPLASFATGREAIETFASGSLDSGWAREELRAILTWDNPFWPDHWAGESSPYTISAPARTPRTPSGPSPWPPHPPLAGPWTDELIASATATPPAQPRRGRAKTGAELVDSIAPEKLQLAISDAFAKAMAETGVAVAEWHQVGTMLPGGEPVLVQDAIDALSDCDGAL